MKRYDDWAGLLDAFVCSRMKTRFQWGLNDCVLFACDAVLIMTGEDLARGFRDRYFTLHGAAKSMREFGASSVGELADIMADRCDLRVLPPLFAQRGDVVLLDRELGESLGVVSLHGVEVWAPAEEGLVTVPLSEVIRAWRI